MELLQKSLKFACNIGTMFPSTMDLPTRLSKAVSLGFSAVEIAFPYTWTLEEWDTALEKTPGLKVVLINTPRGSGGEPGLASYHGKSEEFLEGIRKGIEYCRALKCPNLHVMAGNGPLYKGQHSTFLGNMRLASEELKAAGITGLLETISGGVIPNYYLNEPNMTLRVVDEISCPNILFQFDVFHLSMLGLTDTQVMGLYDGHAGKIGHVQVAQTPKRDQVDGAGGVDYSVVFRGLAERGYGGYVGLEYRPDPLEDEAGFEKTVKFISQF